METTKRIQKPCRAAGLHQQKSVHEGNAFTGIHQGNKCITGRFAFRQCDFIQISFKKIILKNIQIIVQSGQRLHN